MTNLAAFGLALMLAPGAPIPAADVADAPVRYIDAGSVAEFVVPPFVKFPSGLKWRERLAGTENFLLLPLLMASEDPVASVVIRGRDDERHPFSLDVVWVSASWASFLVPAQSSAEAYSSWMHAHIKALSQDECPEDE